MIWGVGGIKFSHNQRGRRETKDVGESFVKKRHFRYGKTIFAIFFSMEGMSFRRGY
jgi:hypothetical protein